RQCTTRLSPRTPSPACVLAELRRCLAPCQHRVSVDEYEQRVVAPVRDVMTGDPGVVVDNLRARLDRLADAGRYEEAATLRGRLATSLRDSMRLRRRVSVNQIEELCAARPAGGGWELAVVRHGRLAAAGYAPPRVHPRPVLEAVRATAETVLPGPGPLGGATAEETDRIIDWLERPDTRLVETTAGWAVPVQGAARFTDLLTMAEQAAG